MSIHANPTTDMVARADLPFHAALVVAATVVSGTGSEAGARSPQPMTQSSLTNEGRTHLMISEILPSQQPPRTPGWQSSEFASSQVTSPASAEEGVIRSNEGVRVGRMKWQARNGQQNRRQSAWRRSLSSKKTSVCAHLVESKHLNLPGINSKSETISRFAQAEPSSEVPPI